MSLFFSSGNIVFGFPFRPIFLFKNNFKIIFGWSVKYVSKLPFFFTWTFHYSNIICWKQNYLQWIALLSKISFPYIYVSISALSVTHIYTSIFIKKNHIVNDKFWNQVAFILKSWILSVLHLCSFFKLISLFWQTCAFHFHLNFCNNFVKF